MPVSRFPARSEHAVFSLSFTIAFPSWPFLMATLLSGCCSYLSTSSKGITKASLGRGRTGAVSLARSSMNRHSRFHLTVGSSSLVAFSIMAHMRVRYYFHICFPLYPVHANLCEVRYSTKIPNPTEPHCPSNGLSKVLSDRATIILAIRMPDGQLTATQNRRRTLGSRLRLTNSPFEYELLPPHSIYLSFVQICTIIVQLFVY